MDGERESRGWRRIDAAAKAAFIVALRGGARREDAASSVGFSLTGFYGARRRDPDFAQQWRDALADTAAAERRLAPPGEGGEVRIAAANRRLYQRRRLRTVRFDQRRREIFLAHFAWTCDTRAAAAAAGISESTVSLHCRTDPVFKAEHAAALESGYVHLEAEALRQRLEAQRRLRAAVDAADAPDAPMPAGAADEFERVLKLLARWDRRPNRPGRRAAPDGRRPVWTFDAAVALLERRLAALDVDRLALPAGTAARVDGDPGTGPPVPAPGATGPEP